jgi:hypothetical protein
MSLVEVSEIGYLTWWNFPRKAWLIIISELCVITSLSVSLYLTYLNNVYFQSYANGFSPILVPVLSAAFGISSASIATYLYLGMKRIRASQEPETSIRRRVHSRKPSKRPTRVSTSQPKVADPLPTIPAKLKPIAPTQNHSQIQKPPVKDPAVQSSNHQTRNQT